MLLYEGLINLDLVQKILRWFHTGFNVMAGGVYLIVDRFVVFVALSLFFGNVGLSMIVYT